MWQRTTSILQDLMSTIERKRIYRKTLQNYVNCTGIIWLLPAVRLAPAGITGREVVGKLTLEGHAVNRNFLIK